MQEAGCAGSGVAETQSAVRARGRPGSVGKRVLRDQIHT